MIYQQQTADVTTTADARDAADSVTIPYLLSFSSSSSVVVDVDAAMMMDADAALDLVTTATADATF